MAFSGLNVECGFAGAFGPYATQAVLLPIRRKPVWSEKFSTPGTTANPAPAGSLQDGQPTMTVTSTVDAYIAFGPNPNAGASPRVLLLASSPPETFVVELGDKLAWIAA